MQSNEDRAVEVVPQDYSYVFNPYREPMAKVKPGERVTIHTDDAFESRITKKEDLPSRALATAKFLILKRVLSMWREPNRAIPLPFASRASCLHGTSP